MESGQKTASSPHNNALPHPVFFVSVASKRLKYCASPLSATHTRWAINVASKGFRLHRNCAHCCESWMGTGGDRNLAAIVPKHYCTREIEDRQEETAASARQPLPFLSRRSTWDTNGVHKPQKGMDHPEAFWRVAWRPPANTRSSGVVPGLR